MEIESEKISLITIGNTGSGKSTLLNAILGENAFIESFGVYSETNETVGKKGSFENCRVFVVDTPGLQDNRGTDQQHLIQMVEYIKQTKSLKAIVFVISFLNCRVDESIIRLLQLISQMYPGKKWYHHFSIVWSHYYSDLPKNLKDTVDIKRTGILKLIKENVVQTIPQEELNTIPQYFIDSVEARSNPKSKSREELRYLLAWVSQLQPLNETLGIIQNVDKDIKHEEIEEQRRVVSDTTELDIRTIVTALFVRTKKTLYNGNVLYSDWEEKEGTRNKTTKQLIAPPPNRKTEKRENITLLGTRKFVEQSRNGREKGKILQKRLKTVSERDVLMFEDGRIKELPWRVVDEKEDEIPISEFDNIGNINDTPSRESNRLNKISDIITAADGAINLLDKFFTKFN